MQQPDSSDMVWVTWQDSVGESQRTHWDDLSSIRLSKNVNVGWIAHEDAQRIVLAHGFCSTGEVDNLAIPKGDILSITPVVVQVHGTE